MFHQTIHTMEILFSLSLQIYHYVTHYNNDDNDYNNVSSP